MRQVDEMRSNILHDFLAQEKTREAASQTGVVCHDHHPDVALASLTPTVVSRQ